MRAVDTPAVHAYNGPWLFIALQKRNSGLWQPFVCGPRLPLKGCQARMREYNEVYSMTNPKMSQRDIAPSNDASALQTSSEASDDIYMKEEDTSADKLIRRGKINLVLPASLLLLAIVISLLLPELWESETPADIPITEDTVIITVGGEEKLRVPLSQPQTVTLTQPGGEENVIVVTESGVYMESATCHNQICVHSGYLTTENYDYRPDGPFIICLPNQVSVELVVYTDNAITQ